MDNFLFDYWLKIIYPKKNYKTAEEALKDFCSFCESSESLSLREINRYSNKWEKYNVKVYIEEE